MEVGADYARIEMAQDSGWADIAVAVLPTIGDYDAYEVGVGIYRTWKVGRRDSIGSARRDLGVLLLIVPKEVNPDSAGHCWITTGLGKSLVVLSTKLGRFCAAPEVTASDNRLFFAAARLIT